MKNKVNLYLISLISILFVCFIINGSSVAFAASEHSVSQKELPANNGFPYPRGEIPPYGYMGCEEGNTCIEENATLIHFGWAFSITPQEFVDNVRIAKKLGINKYLVNTGGPEMSNESFWKRVRDLGITDNDFYGVYFPDEPNNPSEIIAMHTAMKKYFPNAVAGTYFGAMSQGGDEAFIPGLDIAFFTTYTKFHPERPHAWVYGILIANGPAWKNASKTIFSATEAFGEACMVNPDDPDLNATQKVNDRQISQIVMGILGGAQGVFSYANKYAKGTPCDTGWASFEPRYEQVWPWVMEGNRSLLSTNVTSGTKNVTYSPNSSSPGLRISAVTAYDFTDAEGRKLVASSSMLDFTEANGTENNATISNVLNGTYDVLWENRTVNVTDGTINDTWQPYSYHFYQLRTKT